MKAKKNKLSHEPVKKQKSVVARLQSLASWPNRHLLFIPLIIAGGRLACRVVLNLWNMIEG